MIDTAMPLSREETLDQERADFTQVVIFPRPFQMFLMIYLEIFEVAKTTETGPQEARIFVITSI